MRHWRRACLSIGSCLAARWSRRVSGVPPSPEVCPPWSQYRLQLVSQTGWPPQAGDVRGPGGRIRRAAAAGGGSRVRAVRQWRTGAAGAMSRTDLTGPPRCSEEQAAECRVSVIEVWHLAEERDHLTGVRRPAANVLACDRRIAKMNPPC